MTIPEWLDRLAHPGRPDELETKQLLASFGIAAPRGVRLGADQSVAGVIADLTPPFAVKVCSPEVIHKSERGGVTLGVSTKRLSGAVTAMRARFPGYPVLVEEQLIPAGPELIAGALVDPEFGPAIMVGSGGALTELYRDVAFRLAPCQSAEVERMLEELAVAPLFDGYRGSSLDRGGLTRLLVHLAELTVALGPGLGELDLNPIAQVADDWIALDAALILAPQPT